MAKPFVKPHALGSTDASEGAAALADLVADGNEAAVEVIAAALLESHWPACNNLAEALAKIGSTDAREALIRALRGRRHHMRSAAIKALAQLGGRGVREAIAKLHNDRSYEVRQDVAEALNRLGERGSGP